MAGQMHWIQPSKSGRLCKMNFEQLNSLVSRLKWSANSITDISIHYYRY